NEDSVRIGRLHAAAETLHASYVSITAETLEANRQRIQNSLRMLRFLSAARCSSLTEARNAVLTCLSTQRYGLALHELSARISEVPEALVCAAAFQLLQHGRVAMDVNESPLTGMTSVSRVS